MAEVGFTPYGTAFQSSITEIDTGDEIPAQQARVTANGNDEKAQKPARELLENTNFSPRKPENSATLNVQVFGFGDFYANHPVNPKKVDTPFSVLHMFANQNLITFGKPTSTSGVPMFVTIPVNPHGLSVGSTITGDTPGGFAVLTPPGLVIPKPFGVTYADLDGNVGAITGLWSVNQIGRLGFTVGARLIANANISGFLNNLDPTPRDLDALVAGGTVEKTYNELQGYDQHGTLNALGINSLKNYKQVIESISNEGGYNLPVDISDLAWRPALSIDLVNRQVSSHLVNQMSVVNDVDGSQTARQLDVELDQVNQQIDIISIKLESVPYTMNSIVIGDADLHKSYESELNSLKAQRQALEDFRNDLPARFSHDIYSPEKIQKILTNYSRNEERLLLNIEDKINGIQQQLNDAKHSLARTMSPDEIQALEQKIPEIETRINALQDQKTLLSASWRLDNSSEGYAVTQALAATNAKIESIENTLMEMSKGPIGMPLNNWEKQANYQLEKSILTDLTTLYDDKQKLQGWLQANTPIPVERY